MGQSFRTSWRYKKNSKVYHRRKTPQRREVETGLYRTITEFRVEFILDKALQKRRKTKSGRLSTLERTSLLCLITELQSSPHTPLNPCTPTLSTLPRPRTQDSKRDFTSWTQTCDLDSTNFSDLRLMIIFFHCVRFRSLPVSSLGLVDLWY